MKDKKFYVQKNAILPVRMRDDCRFDYVKTFSKAYASNHQKIGTVNAQNGARFLTSLPLFKRVKIGIFAHS
jgi:hypothetical protein